MAFIFGKSRREKERDRLFKEMKQAADAGFLLTTSSVMHDIVAKGLLKDPELPFLLNAAITGMAQKSLPDAFALAMWLIRTFDDKELRKSVAFKTLSLIESVDRSNSRLVQLAFEAANVVGAYTEQGSEENKAGRTAGQSFIKMKP